MVDTMGDFVQALNAMLAEVLPPTLAGHALDAATIKTMVGKGSEHLVDLALNTAFPNAGIGFSAIDRVALHAQALASYQRHYAAVNGLHAHTYPGVEDGLRGLLAAKLKLVCLTNKPLGFARLLLQRKGLDRFFGAVFGGDSFERKKPDPLPLRKVCEFLGTAPARTLVIGDSSNDALAARAAGCPVVLVTYGYNHGEPVRQVDADGFVDSLVALVPR